MKKIKYALSAFLLVLASSAFSQGLQGIVVEKYYSTNAADGADAAAEFSTSPLATGTTVYRVYVDMAAGYKFSQLYGNAAHNLTVNTTTNFYNDPNYGVAINPGTISLVNIAKNTAMIDSWFTTGGVAATKAGVLKSEDTDGSVGNSDNLLANNAGGCFGLPITGAGSQDGFAPSNVSTYIVPNTLGLGSALDVLAQTEGNSIVISNGAIAALGGVIGATSSNMVCVAQFTTSGDLSFQFNVQLVNISSGLAENYVASNPTSGELTHPTLTYSGNVAPVVALTAPANGASVVAGNSLTISATATDANGTITSVEFFVDGISVGVDATSPYSVVYTPVVGTDVITVVATDSDCESTTSAPRTITANAVTPGAPANDNFANATLIAGASYPYCNGGGNASGNLSGATASPESDLTAPVGAGQDVWYRVVASSAGIRVQASSTQNNLVLEFHDAAGNMLFSENETTTGAEVLIANGLTPGATYYVAVRNFNASSVGTFNICIQKLAGVLPNNGTTFNNLCGFIGFNWTGATSYSVTFTNGANNYTVNTTSGRIPFASFGGLQYNTSYTVNVTTTFILADAVGNTTTVQVTAQPFTVNFTNGPSVAMRLSDSFPTTTKSLGSFIRTDIVVCGHVGFQWEFNLLSGLGGEIESAFPLEVSTTSLSSFFQVSQIPGVLPGQYYQVRVRPIFPGNVFGNYGIARELAIAGSAPSGMTVANGSEVFTPSAVTAADRAFEVYPNPNTGDVFNVRLAGINSEVVIVRMLDAMGRVVYNNQFTVAGSLNTSIVMEEKLSSGMYMIQVIDGEETMNNRMIVR